jgi:hypothetical protein|tara:strand:+ start:379 stop:666 length:288 start_codon:yes stop_codon:yes gene_type:complete
MATTNYGLRVTNTIKRTVSTSSAQTAATNANTEYVRLIADTDGVFVAFGSNPTATTSSTYLAANNEEIFKIDGGMKIAAIVASSTANLYIDELSE